MDIAIIGAGMAGLACGAALTASGHNVQLFDKGRGPGGRMSTRRMSAGGAEPVAEYAFDHGAQYFTARDPRFAAQVAMWQSEGVVARWPAAGSDAWVGTPGMNAPVKAMAEKADVAFATRIAGIRREGKAAWLLREDGGTQGPFDAVIVATPAEQAAPLLAAHVPAMADAASAVVSLPCWTLMAAFGERLEADDCLSDKGPIGWAARNSSKPGRGDGECWVVQGSPQWSADNLECEAAEAEAMLLAALGEAVGALPPIITASAHRWRYSSVPVNAAGALWDKASMIGACGDWLLGPRVELAYLSGLTLAEKVCAHG